MEFDPLNVVILKRKPGRPDRPATAARFRQFGNPDDVFAQSRPKSGLITQAEVRCDRPGGVGHSAGQRRLGHRRRFRLRRHRGGPAERSRSRLRHRAGRGRLSSDPGQRLDIRRANLHAVHGIAPDVFADLPAPDAVFVGGTGHEVARLLESAWEVLRPGGQMVVNVATLESLSATHGVLKRLAGSVRVLLVNIARGTEQLETLRFEAVNPTFLLAIGKPGVK